MKRFEAMRKRLGANFTRSCASRRTHVLDPNSPYFHLVAHLQPHSGLHVSTTMLFYRTVRIIACIGPTFTFAHAAVLLVGKDMEFAKLHNLRKYLRDANNNLWLSYKRIGHASKLAQDADKYTFHIGKLPTIWNHP